MDYCASHCTGSPGIDKFYYDVASDDAACRNAPHGSQCPFGCDATYVPCLSSRCCLAHNLFHRLLRGDVVVVVIVVVVNGGERKKGNTHPPHLLSVVCAGLVCWLRAGWLIDRPSIPSRFVVVVFTRLQTARTRTMNE